MKRRSPNQCSELSFVLTSLWIALLLYCPAGELNSQLSELIKATSPCQVRLQPPWTGEAKETVRTGYFKRESSAKNDERGLQLVFDWFNFTDKNSASHFGPITIATDEGENRRSNIYTYVAKLPTDAELTAATTTPLLEKILGPAQGFRDGWGSKEEMHSSAGWSFFSLDAEGHIKTLSIFCMATQLGEGAEWKVDSIKIARGTAKPTVRSLEEYYCSSMAMVRKSVTHSEIARHEIFCAFFLYGARSSRRIGGARGGHMSAVEIWELGGGYQLKGWGSRKRGVKEKGSGDVSCGAAASALGFSG